MDIYTLIQKDHDHLKAQMDKINTVPLSNHNERLELFYPLKDALIAHNESEEESFYVALKQHAKTRNVANYSEKEHHEAYDLLEELDDKSLPSLEWNRNFTLLCGVLLQHMAKEEGHVFAEARTVLTDEKARVLATTMLELKKDHKEFKKQMHLMPKAS